MPKVANYLNIYSLMILFTTQVSLFMFNIFYIYLLINIRLIVKLLSTDTSNTKSW